LTHSRAQTRANYDRLSRWYDLLAGSSERALRDLGLRALAIREGEYALEIGCGTGAALVELARAAGPSGLAVGVDLSIGMCREAGLRTACPAVPGIAAAEVPPGVSLSAAIICGDAAHIPLSGGIFDAVFMSFALELFSEGDMRAVLSECRRVLRSGGRLCVVAMAVPSRHTGMTRLYAWAHRRFPVAIDCRPIAVSQVLALSGFRVERLTRQYLWGLPAEVALASAEMQAVEEV
jgi:demethylmenaquinone methyltransferase/2-methoxy-6-polyprenyl-1,4-benzoquinol methylase